MLVRSTNTPSNCASAATLSGSMAKPWPAGAERNRRLAGIGHQCLVTLCQLALQAGDQGRAGLGILACLFFVAADHISPAGDFDILHHQIGLAFLAWDDERHRHAV